MSTNQLYLLVLLLYLQLPNTITAQSSYQIGVLPSLNIHNKLQNEWAINFKMESRQLLQSKSFDGEVEKGFEYILSDFSLMATKTVGLNTRISSGYLVRFREGQVVHRLIQQFAVVRRMAGFRLSHRLVSDQTFAATESANYRLRYRLASELPLNGQSADSKEFYLKISNEYLNSLQAQEYDLEIRFVPMIGYGITDNHKVEVGLDYRLNSFLTNKGRHSLWMSLNWFFEM